MPKRSVQPRQLRLGEQPQAQLQLPLAEHAPRGPDSVSHWRFCRQCGRPIHEDAPGCGWCRRPSRSGDRGPAAASGLWASDPP